MYVGWKARWPASDGRWALTADIIVEVLMLRPPHLAQRVKERSVESAEGREAVTLLVRLVLRGW